MHQFIELRHTTCVGVLLRWIDQHDGVHLARQVVEHHDRVRHHQQDIRHAQRVGIRAVGQTLLDIAHTVIAKVAHQPAVETWQPGDGRHVVTRLEGFDEVQRVFDIQAFDLDAIMGHADVMTMHAHHGAARQADDRITPPLLAALHRLQQIGVGLIGKLEVDRQRRVEVGQGFAGKRDAVVAFGGQTQEFFTVHEQPRGLRTKRSVRQTCRQAGQDQVRRANASGPGP